MPQMTGATALLLALHDPDYRARKMRGRWCVWSYRSGHVVEFDARVIEATNRLGDTQKVEEVQ